RRGPRRRAARPRPPRRAGPRRGRDRQEPRRAPHHPRLTMDVPLEILDREVARAAGALAAARAEVAREGAPNPLAAHRRVSTRATWVELAGASGPLAAPLRDWVAALTLERVLWDDAVRLEVAWRAPSITVAEPQLVAFTESPRDLLVRTLGEADPA